MKLSLALRPTSLPIPGPHVFIEGPNSLGVTSTDEFRIRLRRFLDRLEHFKFAENLQVWSQMDLSSEDQQKLTHYAAQVPLVLRDLKMALGGAEDSWLGLSNMLENIPTILRSPDVSDIKIQGPFHAVVVAAGPSLELEISKLKQIQKNVFIVAVDAVLKRLLKEGITPHAVVATERDDYSVKFFENLPENLKTCLIGQPTIQKRIFDNYPGPKATVFKFSGPFLWLPMKRAEFWAAGSSAHVAYRIAAYLNATSIALVGQDLSYHPDTLQSHAQLEDYPEWAEARSANELPHAEKVRGNTREHVYTNSTWRQFANDYAIIAEETKCPTFNTSQLGMKIPTISYQSFQEWIEKSNILSMPSLRHAIPTSNPREYEETKAVEQKKKEAILELTTLSSTLARKLRDEEINSLYEKINSHHHFLALGLEMLMTDYFNTENKIFRSSAQEATILKRNYLDKVNQVVIRLLDLLSSTIRQSS